MVSHILIAPQQLHALVDFAQDSPKHPPNRSLTLVRQIRYLRPRCNEKRLRTTSPGRRKVMKTKPTPILNSKPPRKRSRSSNTRFVPPSAKPEKSTPRNSCLSKRLILTTVRRTRANQRTLLRPSILQKPLCSTCSKRPTPDARCDHNHENLPPSRSDPP